MAHDAQLMPVGPHAGKPLNELDLEYLERCLSYDSSWAQYRHLFLQEIERRRQVELRKHAAAGEQPHYAEEPARPPQHDDAVVHIKVALPSWLVKRVKIDAVLRDMTTRGYVEHALKLALESR